MQTERNEAETPTVQESYAHAWASLKAHPRGLLSVFLVFGILQLPSNLELEGSWALLTGLYQLLVVGPLTFGLSYAFLMAVRGRAPTLTDLFAPFQQGYVAAVTAAVVLPAALMIAALPMLGAAATATLDDSPQPVFIALALLLFGLPIFAAVRLSFVPYLLVEERLGPVGVLGESWARTQPLQLRIFAIELLSVPLVACGLALLLVGVVPAMILAGLALATAYDRSRPVVAADDPDPAA